MPPRHDIADYAAQNVAALLLDAAGCCLIRHAMPLRLPMMLYYFRIAATL